MCTTCRLSLLNERLRGKQDGNSIHERHLADDDDSEVCWSWPKNRAACLYCLFQTVGRHTSFPSYRSRRGARRAAGKRRAPAAFSRIVPDGHARQALAPCGDRLPAGWARVQVEAVGGCFSSLSLRRRFSGDVASASPGAHPRTPPISCLAPPPAPLCLGPGSVTPGGGGALHARWEQGR